MTSANRSGDTGQKPLTLIPRRSVQVAEWLALLMLDHEVVGSNPAGGEIQLMTSRTELVIRKILCGHPFLSGAVKNCMEYIFYK